MGKILRKIDFYGNFGDCRERMIVEGCKSGDFSVDFWEDGRDEHCDTVAAKGTEGQILYSLYI